MSSSNALVTTVTVPTTEVSNKAMEDTLQEIVGFINTARLLEASKMAWDPGVVTTRWMLSKEIASTLVRQPFNHVPVRLITSMHSYYYVDEVLQGPWHDCHLYPPIHLVSCG